MSTPRRPKLPGGDTAEYKEFETKHGKRSASETKAVTEKLMEIIAEFGPMKEKDPSDTGFQAQVKKLQDYISENFYACSNDTLSGLGKMYAAGGDFTKNIDAAGGEGTAEFINKAIQVYVK